MPATMERSSAQKEETEYKGPKARPNFARRLRDAINGRDTEDLVKGPNGVERTRILSREEQGQKLEDLLAEGKEVFGEEFENDLGSTTENRLKAVKAELEKESKDKVA